MRVTIIKDDNAVSIDGVRYSVDCSTLPRDFHVLQWDGSRGEIEFVSHMYANDPTTWHKKPNQMLTDIASYQRFLEAWQHAKAEDDKVKSEAAEAAQKAITYAPGP